MIGGAVRHVQTGYVNPTFSKQYIVTNQNKYYNNNKIAMVDAISNTITQDTNIQYHDLIFKIPLSGFNDSNKIILITSPINTSFSASYKSERATDVKECITWSYNGSSDVNGIGSSMQKSLNGYIVIRPTKDAIEISTKIALYGFTKSAYSAASREFTKVGGTATVNIALTENNSATDPWYYAAIEFY